MSLGLNAALDNQELVTPPTLDYSLPDISSIRGGVRWHATPLEGNPGSIQLQATSSAGIGYFLIQKQGWIPAVSADFGPYLEFDLQTTTQEPAVPANSATFLTSVPHLVCEPWAIAQELHMTINGQRVTQQQNSSFPSIMASNIMRMGLDRARTDGSAFGLRSTADVVTNVGTPLGTPTAYNYRVSQGMAPPTLNPPRLIGSPDGVALGPLNHFQVPIPRGFCPLAGDHMFPVHLLAGETKIELTWNASNFLCYLSTIPPNPPAVVPAVNALLVSNIRLWVPYVQIHPVQEAEIMRRLNDAASDASKALVIDTGMVDVFRVQSNNVGGFQTVLWPAPASWVNGIEIVQQVSPLDPTLYGWLASQSCRMFIQNYRIWIDGQPTTETPVNTSDLTVGGVGASENFHRYLAFAYSLARENDVEEETLVTRRMMYNVDPDQVAAAATNPPTFPSVDYPVVGAPNSPLSYFSMTEVLRAPGRDGLQSSRAMNSLQLDYNKSALPANSATTNLIIMRHGKQRILLSASTCNVFK